MRAEDDTVEPTELSVVVDDDSVGDAEAGARRGRVVAEATSLGRDLADCPAGYLTATRMGEVAREVGARAGLQVEPPTMVKLSYRPQATPRAHLGLVARASCTTPA
jgi:leucyl aminopeptidase